MREKNLVKLRQDEVFSSLKDRLIVKEIYSVAVLGSTGYVGLELIKLLLNHPNVNINFLGCENPKNLSINFFDDINVDKNLPGLQLNENFDPLNFDVLFLALPHGASHNYVKKFNNKIKIIDLSADFRLDSLDLYKLNYKEEHSCPEFLNSFVYGLPELNKAKLKNISNVSIPGCYPTSILTPLIPLLNKELLSSESIIIDSKSGYSGAGKKFLLSNIKNSEDFNFYNYSTNEHRHICEIQQELNKHSTKKINFSFNPHILPIYRGMMSTIYCDLNNGVTAEDVKNTFKDFTRNLPFVKFLSNDEKADFFSVQNTNNCLIKMFKHHDTKKIIIVSLIDNLIKGAAGQAVQCFNIISNLDEKSGFIN